MSSSSGSFSAFSPVTNQMSSSSDTVYSRGEEFSSMPSWYGRLSPSTYGSSTLSYQPYQSYPHSWWNVCPRISCCNPPAVSPLESYPYPMNGSMWPAAMSYLDSYHSPHGCQSRLNATCSSPRSYEKPAQSYVGLIGKAILSSPEKKLILSDIYSNILSNYPYFRNKGTGWRNSIRHNLSLNDCFIKAGRSPNGKGHFWVINPLYYQEFLNGEYKPRRISRFNAARSCPSAYKNTTPYTRKTESPSAECGICKEDKNFIQKSLEENKLLQEKESFDRQRVQSSKVDGFYTQGIKERRASDKQSNARSTYDVCSLLSRPEDKEVSRQNPAKDIKNICKSHF